MPTVSDRQYRFDLGDSPEDKPCDAAPENLSNFLAQFRRPMTDAEMDEAAKDFEAAVIAWLNETDNETP